ncbi:hypothetical protein BGZ61DRAFT_200635 [Ilyonectria robusta]|uniref:uncharacterized protein n=1 Tax=Ilyonectria robusta TaxID=1079257 RepID=UPI001E8D05D2|nr:uncharacterized protein BGZ61DRAFT_200635 [Ilyonectria robusta]KAH8722148.1 hypothetical protein BGZ61DRAFT_200635 [Ilyonectria robusta]
MTEQVCIRVVHLHLHLCIFLPYAVRVMAIVGCRHPGLLCRRRFHHRRRIVRRLEHELHGLWVRSTHHHPARELLSGCLVLLARRLGALSADDERALSLSCCVPCVPCHIETAEWCQAGPVGPVTKLPVPSNAHEIAVMPWVIGSFLHCLPPLLQSSRVHMGERDRRNRLVVKAWRACAIRGAHSIFRGQFHA